MRCAVVIAVLAAFAVPAFVHAQAITPSRDEVIALTSGWGGERFEDGRPKVPTPSWSA